MIRLKKYRVWLLFAVLTICGTASFASCSSKENNATNGKVAEILDRGTILFGTTGDYRPLSFCEPKEQREQSQACLDSAESRLRSAVSQPDGTYWGFGIEVAKEIANKLGVSIEFRKTSWPTLTADALTEPQLFDLAIGGITITDTRLAAPLLDAPFTHGEIGVLMQKGQEDLLQIVNNVIRQMKSDGSLRKLHEKYGLMYAYE